MFLTSRRGFTLVELAIAMMIIGLLIGGVMKGQELIESARVVSTINEIRAYETSIATFRDIYDDLPGDMNDGSQRIPGCNNSCNIALYNPTNQGSGEDGMVGVPGWGSDSPWGDWTVLVGTITPNTPPGAPLEPQVFWISLLKTNFITGITDQAIHQLTDRKWGVTHPAAKIGGGWIVGNGDGSFLPGQTSGIKPRGLLLVLNQEVGFSISSGSSGSYPVSPKHAEQIDRKIDDGKPSRGLVLSYGIDGGADQETGCFSTFNGRVVYSTKNSALDCGIVVRTLQ